MLGLGASSQGPRSSGGGLAKLKIPGARTRTRTWSADSGCEVGCDSPCDVLEETLSSWSSRLEGVVAQEIARGRELTTWAKDALRQIDPGDEEGRSKVMEGWRRQMEGVLEFTADLVDCVNNDTREGMVELVGGEDREIRNITSLEERREDEEREEEIMKLFWTPCVVGEEQRPLLETMKMKRRVKRMKMRGIKEFGMRELKIKVGAKKKKQRKQMGSKKHQTFQILKMFQSALDAEDIFDDWNWNFGEVEEAESILSEWRWNMEVNVELRKKYYDDIDTTDAWNSFNFWNIGREVKELSEEEALEVLATDCLATDSCSIDSGCYSPELEVEKEKQIMNYWNHCQFWQESFQNENIINSLLEEEVMDLTPVMNTTNFWDESAAQQASIELLMRSEQQEKESQKLWKEAGKVVFATPAPPYFPWEDPESIESLVNSEEEEENYQDISFFWEDQNTAEELLTLEEEGGEMEKPWEWMDREALIALVAEVEEDGAERSLDNWPLWTEWGTAKDILKNYEDSRIGEDVFSEVNLDGGKYSVQDELETFKKFRFIFEEKEEVEVDELADYLDIYSDWARGLERRRERRGRGRRRRAPVARTPMSRDQEVAVKRPGTPNIQEKKVKTWDFEAGWIETKERRQGREGRSRKASRAQGKLQTKIHPKQPPATAYYF